MQPMLFFGSYSSHSNGGRLMTSHNRVGEGEVRHRIRQLAPVVSQVATMYTMRDWFVTERSARVPTTQPRMLIWFACAQELDRADGCISAGNSGGSSSDYKSWTRTNRNGKSPRILDRTLKERAAEGELKRMLGVAKHQNQDSVRLRANLIRNTYFRVDKQRTATKFTGFTYRCGSFKTTMIGRRWPSVS